MIEAGGEEAFGRLGRFGRLEGGKGSSLISFGNCVHRMMVSDSFRLSKVQAKGKMLAFGIFRLFGYMYPISTRD